MPRFRKAATLLATAIPLVFLCLCGHVLSMAVAITLHECAHLLSLRLCRGRICSFRAAPFGLCIVYDENTLSLRNEFWVTISGCAANFCVACVCIGAYALEICDLLVFGIVNALVCGMNLLPILPLDGAHALELLLSAWTTPVTAARVLRICTHVSSFFLFLFSSYLLLWGQIGLYPLLFSVYIFSVNARALSGSEF